MLYDNNDVQYFCRVRERIQLRIYLIFVGIKNREWISDMGIDGPTFVPKSGYF